MITSHLDGGIFFAYFQNGGKRFKPKQKVAYLSKYFFDFEEVDIKLYLLGMLRQCARSFERLAVMLT